jgi:hypothetical protein
MLSQPGLRRTASLGDTAVMGPRASDFGRGSSVDGSSPRQRDYRKDCLTSRTARTIITTTNGALSRARLVTATTQAQS